MAARAAATECSVSGRVTGADGQPIAGAAVTATRRGFAAFTAAQPAGGATSDSSGSYCIAGLAPGEYEIRAAARRHAPSSSPGCVECCAPGTERGVGLLRRMARGSRADLRLSDVPAFCVRGEVRDSKGVLMPGAAISVVAPEGGFAAGVLNEGGRFLLTRLPAGVYRIEVRDTPGLLGRLLVSRAVEVRGANVNGVVVRVPGQ